MQHDELGEKHIADVRAPHGLVLEFQHSNIDPLERVSRERFHKNMWWVVDGARLKRDYPRFKKGSRSFVSTNRADFFLVPDPKKCFPMAWLESRVSVFFDFLGVEATDAADPTRDVLWQLLPGRQEGQAIIVAVSRIRFVEAVTNGPQVAPSPPFVRNDASVGKGLGLKALSVI